MSIDRSLQFGQMKYGMLSLRLAASEPVVAAVPPELDPGRDEDQRPHVLVAPVSAELRDVPEVLAVEADDEGGDEEQRRGRSQPLRHLVLVVGDLRLLVVPEARQQVARELQAVEGAHQL